jgi:hypothetical protein
VAGSSVRTAVLDNLWLADLTQMQATYAQCPEGRPGWFPKCLLIQGRCPAEYLALLPSHTARVITSARSGKLCAMDLQSDQKMGSISAHMHSCMHCGRTKRYHGCAVHRMLQCAAMASNVAQFKDKDFGQSMDWDASPMPWCCPFCHRSGKISHHGRPRFCIGTRSQLYFDLWRKRGILRMTRTTALVLKILRATY